MQFNNRKDYDAMNVLFFYFQVTFREKWKMRICVIDVEIETCKDQNQQRSRGNAGDRADVRFLTFIFGEKEKLFEFLVFSVEKHEKTKSQQRLIGSFATNIIPSLCTNWSHFWVTLILLDQ